MSVVLFEVAIIVLLLLANGVLAMTEIAVVSSRRSRLRQLAERGDAKARAALELAEAPTPFLATVQAGITLVGVLAGAFGGATIAETIGAAVDRMPGLRGYGDAIGIGLVVLGITFLSLVIGELVPKRVGLQAPEAVARLMAGPMHRLARLVHPLVRLLSASTDAVMRLLPFKMSPEPPISEDEVRGLVQEGVRAGVFHRDEPRLVEGVLSLDRLPVRQIMTPRAKIIWLKESDPHDLIWHKIVVSGHSNFPVYRHSREEVLGFVSVKSIYAHMAAGIPVRLADLVMPAQTVKGTDDAARVLELFKRTGSHIALVRGSRDELIGLITLIDITEAIVGDFPSPAERLRPSARKCNDGSWLVDAALPVESLKEALPMAEFPAADQRDYFTLGQFVVSRLGRAPVEGESFHEQGCRFEIIDMDGERVDKLLVKPLQVES